MRKVKFKVVRTICGKRYSAFISGWYGLEYPGGTIVRAREETLGVAVFKTKRQAEEFIEERKSLKIIHVRPIGRGKTVKLICDVIFEEDIRLFYNNRKKTYLRTVPSGTIFYPAVEVLD